MTLRLQIIDPTTITLIFNGVGRHAKTDRKKSGINVYANIHANEGVPYDIKYTSVATNDSFMLRPSNYSEGNILAIDRVDIDYGKFEKLTKLGVVYVTKKKNLVYDRQRYNVYIGERTDGYTGCSI